MVIINWQAGFILVEEGGILTRIPSYPCDFDSAKSHNTMGWPWHPEIQYYQNHMGSVILKPWYSKIQYYQNQNPFLALGLQG